MTSSEEELREELLDEQHTKLWTISLMFMLALPYMVGMFLLAFVPSVSMLHIGYVILGGWIATISYWTFYGKSYVMKRWYPELFEWYKKIELSRYMDKLKDNMDAEKT